MLTVTAVFIFGQDNPIVFKYTHIKKRSTISLYKAINLLTPNVNYSGRTAPLTSKVAFYIFIQQI